MKTVAKARVLVTRFPYQSRWGGEEVHTLVLMRELDKLGIDAFFMGSDPVLLEAFGKAKFIAQKRWLFFPPVSHWTLLGFTLLSPLLFILSGIYLGRMKKRYDIDSVYMLSFGEKLLMTPWAHWMGLKVLWLEHARIGRWLTANPWRRIYTWNSQFARTVVTSRAMLPYVAPLAKHVEAIPCALMLEKMEPLPAELEAFLASGFSVGTVARLTLDKGVDKIAKLVHNKPDVRLVFIGDGPLAPLVEKATWSGQVFWLKSLTRGQLMNLYSKLDLFILGSMEFDPFGMVASEAMAMGAPTLITKACGFAADLHSGKEALIVEPKFASLDKALKQVIKHPEQAKQMAKRGQSFVKHHYRLEPMVTQFAKRLLK
jgi:glycosyltransferase involved in cell wall biosynthesis